MACEAWWRHNSRFRETMVALRLIPCLDVADGRVVKGVNFVGLRDAVTRWVGLSLQRRGR